MSPNRPLSDDELRPSSRAWRDSAIEAGASSRRGARPFTLRVADADEAVHLLRGGGQAPRDRGDRIRPPDLPRLVEEVRLGAKR